MNYEDLMARINKSYSEAKQNIGDQDDTRVKWRNADRRRGFKRYEVLVKAKTLISLFGKIFKKEKRK